MPFMRRSYRTSGRRAYRGRRKRITRRRKPMTTYRVKRIINAELKFRVLAAGPSAITPSVGDIIPITDPIVLGDTAQDRTGNWISPMNLHGTVVLKGNSVPDIGADSFLIRVGFIQWMNDTQFDSPSITQIMQDPLAPFGPFNIANKGSFKSLWSRKVLISNDVDNPKFFATLPFYLRLSRGRKVLYDDGNPKKFGLYFYVLSDSIIENQPVFNLDFTLRYTDS